MFEITNLSTQKMQHVNGPDPLLSQDRMRCMRFPSVNYPEARESHGLVCSSSCVADEMRRFERVKERRRSTAESLTLFSND